MWQSAAWSPACLPIAIAIACVPACLCFSTHQSHRCISLSVTLEILFLFPTKTPTTNPKTNSAVTAGSGGSLPVVVPDTFVLAENGDVAKARARYERTLQWRKDLEVDDILRVGRFVTDVGRRGGRAGRGTGGERDGEEGERGKARERARRDWEEEEEEKKSAGGGEGVCRRSSHVEVSVCGCVYVYMVVCVVAEWVQKPHPKFRIIKRYYPVVSECGSYIPTHKYTYYIRTTYIRRSKSMRMSD
jgi:hypothetical protein